MTSHDCTAIVGSAHHNVQQGSDLINNGQETRGLADAGAALRHVSVIELAVSLLGSQSPCQSLPPRHCRDTTFWRRDWVNSCPYVLIADGNPRRGRLRWSQEPNVTIICPSSGRSPLSAQVITYPISPATVRSCLAKLRPWRPPPSRCRRLTTVDTTAGGLVSFHWAVRSLEVGQETPPRSYACRSLGASGSSLALHFCLLTKVGDDVNLVCIDNKLPVPVSIRESVH